MKIHHIEKIHDDNIDALSGRYNENNVKQMMYTAYRYAIYDIILYGISFALGVLLGLYVLKNF